MSSIFLEMIIIIYYLFFIFKCYSSGIPISTKATSRSFIKASDGIDIEILSRLPPKNKEHKNKKVPLLFIHGSGAGAWIWDEYWLDFFALNGYPSYAVSLRGSAATGNNGKKDAVKLDEHVNDLKKVLKNLQENNNIKPCILGHSFGGLVLTKLFEDNEARKLVSSAVWMCAVPPSGQGRMALRFFRTRFWSTLNILRGFALGQARTDPKLNKKIFYDSSIDLKSVKTYMDRLALDEEISEDIAGVEMQQPSKNNYGDQASWVNDAQFKRYVIGAEDDMIVDPPAIKETANFVGSDIGAVIIKGLGHNIMLTPKWKVGAEAILNILNQTN